MATAMVQPINSGNAGDTGPYSVTIADRYWQAVLTHDRSFDGSFVYAVRSTGIYCRPSCASRRPRREQVTFYPRADDAENAGFRACRRCGNRSDRANGAREQLVGKALGALDAVEEIAPTLGALSAQLETSPRRL